MTKHPESWADADLVFVTAIHCPRCLTTKPVIVRTVTENDHSVTRRYVCRRCSKRFIVVIEPPE